MKHIYFSVFLFLVFINGFSQISPTYTSSEILQKIKMLKVLGSVLYIAAHPDDENTRLISYLANASQYRTGYLSLTRGDGGQNLIGNEQGVELGLIRTQELLAARRIDGGEQFFSRAIDFGYSKNPNETFQFWDKEAILGDVVWVIRKFQPDVIIARFPEDSRAGHGQHSASGILARLGYTAAASPDSFPQQLGKQVQVWQAKRMLWNTFNFDANNTTSDKQFKLEVNDFLPLLGKSVGELASQSRSQHKSQGFGVSRQWGSTFEYFETIQGSKPETNLLDGVNTSWSRIPGAAYIEPIIDKIIENYNPDNPAASTSALLQLYKELQEIDTESNWVEIKRDEVKKLIIACAGIYMELTMNKPVICANNSSVCKLSVIARTDVACTIKSVKNGVYSRVDIDSVLQRNKLYQRDFTQHFKVELMVTQPYWLRLPRHTGMFNVTDQDLIGMAENNPLSFTIVLTIDSVNIYMELPIQYRNVDPIKAEQYNPVYFSNDFLIYNNPGILLFKKNSSDSANIEVNIIAQTLVNASNGVVKLISDSTSFSHEFVQPTASWQPGNKKVVSLKIPNYLKKVNKQQDILEISYAPGGSYGTEAFFNTDRSIAYEHIPTQTWHYQDKIKVLNIDLKTEGKNIGYIVGAGDLVPQALQQMGYTVTLLKQEDLVYEKLKQYDAIVTGVRAYNIHEYLSSSFDDLMLYVQNGGNLIVQYNTNNNVGPVKARMSPYNLNISRSRVTDETAKVNFLLPGHPVLNFPNKITDADFEGWVQERSIYNVNSLDAKFVTPIGMSDPGEESLTGSLAIAKYGKGNFIYTGLVFFRQLPAGVAGAYRLFANIVALPKN